MTPRGDGDSRRSTARRGRSGPKVRAAAVVSILLAAGAVAVSSARCSRAAARPTIVLISIDTVRADHLPAYGYRGVETPAIDALARDSVRYENAYTHVPLTLPAHAVLLTGLLPYENGVRDNLGFRLAQSHEGETLASRLRAAGYATGAAVSSWVLRADRGLSAGFDSYDDRMPENATRERAGGDTVDALTGFTGSAAGKPLFLFLHLYEPHFPYSPPEPYRDRYRSSPYDGEIAAADAAVGRFLSFLREKGLYDDALVLLVSDHGESLGDHGEDEHGVFLYRETMRVPLFCKYPRGAHRGTVEAAPVGLVDVVPTILAEIGAPAAETSRMSGRPLSAEHRPGRLLYGESLYPRLDFGWSELEALTGDRYRYIEAPRPELYDLAADPAEKTNLAAGLPAPFRTMRAALAAIPRTDARPEASSPEEIKKLASLGYVHVAGAPANGPLPDPKDRVESLRGFRRLLAAYYDGRDEETIAIGRDLARREPAALSVWTALAGSLERTGRKAEAAAALREGLAHASPASAPEQRAQAYADIARLAGVSGDARLREATLKDAVASDAAPESTRRDLARIYVESGRAQQAVDLLRASRLTEPASWEVLGIALASTGKDSEAREMLERAWQSAPGDARVALNIGILALHRSDAREAREWLTRATSAAPQNPAAWADLGLAQAAGGDEPAAAESWKKALELNPNQYDAAYNLALFELKHGPVDVGRKRMERFVAAAPPARFGRELEEARRLLNARGKA
jgi:choline-sulfatase